MAKADTDVPTVSIISLLSDRRHFIPLLKACVEAQTYPSQKIEWIIVDDGPDNVGPALAALLKSTFTETKSSHWDASGSLRDIATGEFIFFFDDDDLHYPQN